MPEAPDGEQAAGPRPPPGFGGPLPTPPGYTSALTGGTARSSPRRKRTPSSGTGRTVLLVVLLVALCVAVLAGVWSQLAPDDPDGERAAATTDQPEADDPNGPGAVYAGWYRAIAAKEFPEACSVLSSNTLLQMTANGTPCESVMAASAQRIGSPKGGATIEILEEAIDGDRAVVYFQLGTEEPETEPADLRLEDGHWKLDLFAAYHDDEPASSTGSTAPSGT